MQIPNTKLKKIHDEIVETFQRLLTINSMLRGSYGKAYRRCGKPNCRCADSENEGHVFYRISWTEKGRSYTRNVPEQDRVWVEQAVENRKKFIRQKKQILSLQKIMDNELTKIEQKVIEKSRKKKKYLE